MEHDARERIAFMAWMKIREKLLKMLIKIKVKIVSLLSMKAENQCEIIRFSNSPMHQK